MKAFIYMNHNIRDRKNVESDAPEPVVTVQIGNRRVNCNNVEFEGRGRVRFRKLKTPGHDVRAYVEIDAASIRSIT